MDGRFVAYYRVSTDRQGQSGLGLEAQRAAVLRYLNAGAWELIAEHTEVETGKNNARPELAKAMRQAKASGAVLIVAKLDRLSRNAAFLLALRDGGVRFVCADMPEANNLTIGVLAVVAEHEREAISARTKAALAAKMARGEKVGGHGAEYLRKRNALYGNADAIQGSRQAADKRAQDRQWAIEETLGLSLNAAAKELNRQRILTARDCQWTPMAVKRMRERLGL